MSFNLFSKKKEDDDHKDTSEVKKATISDTQQSTVSEQNVQPATTAPTQEFVNPFSQNNSQNFQTPQEFDANIANANLNKAMGSGQNNLNAYGGQNQNTGSNVNPFAQEQGMGGQAVGNENNAIQNMNVGSQNMGQGQPQGQNGAQGGQIQGMGGQGQQPAFNAQNIQELVDETVEKILDERWNEMTNNVNKVLSWKNKVEEDIKHLEDGILELNDGFKNLEKKILNKISSYDKNILDVNSEIKALEKVFQKITPTLINNVNQLSRIADDIKGSKSKNSGSMLPEEVSFDDSSNSKSKVSEKEVDAVSAIK